MSWDLKELLDKSLNVIVMFILFFFLVLVIVRRRFPREKSDLPADLGAWSSANENGQSMQPDDQAVRVQAVQRGQSLHKQRRGLDDFNDQSDDDDVDNKPQQRCRSWRPR